MNAFFTEKSSMFYVKNFGYLKPSRIHNIEWFRHKQQDDFYINMERNQYHDEDYRAAVRALVQGKPVYTADRVDDVFMGTVISRNERKQKQIERRAKKAKKRI
mmetsp:Transcript_12480/g.15965  ORF Transcript_12480/g.15965 Transcript_12480/m.15965 type:complete len:103 (-) Transcript_12480:95-403(-)